VIMDIFTLKWAITCVVSIEFFIQFNTYSTATLGEMDSGRLTEVKTIGL